jgi:hypothetical protein
MSLIEVLLVAPFHFEGALGLVGQVIDKLDRFVTEYRLWFSRILFE